MKEKVILVVKDGLRYSVTSLFPTSKIASMAPNATTAANVLATTVGVPLKAAAAAASAPAVQSTVMDSMLGGIGEMANAATNGASAMGSSIVNLLSTVYGYRAAIGALLALGSAYVLYRKYRKDYASASANVTVNVNCNHASKPVKPQAKSKPKAESKPKTDPKSKPEPASKTKAPAKPTLKLEPTEKTDPKSNAGSEAVTKIEPPKTDLKPEVTKDLVVPKSTATPVLPMPLFEQHQKNDVQLTEKVVVCRPLTLGNVNLGLLCQAEEIPVGNKSTKMTATAG